MEDFALLGHIMLAIARLVRLFVAVHISVVSYGYIRLYKTVHKEDLAKYRYLLQ